MILDDDEEFDKDMDKLYDYLSRLQHLLSQTGGTAATPPIDLGIDNAHGNSGDSVD